MVWTLEFIISIIIFTYCSSVLRGLLFIVLIYYRITLRVHILI
jgi:hypothetical protein